MSNFATHEYAALRETIRSRGTMRPVACLGGISLWAAVLVGVLIWLPNPLAAAVPLTVLLTTFEVLRSLHVGVERIGRYLQVFFEESGDGSLSPPCWEQTAMRFGPQMPGAGVHPLFLPVFLIATLLNFLAVIFPGPVPLELATLAVPHVAFVMWMLQCHRALRKQRSVDLARYRALKAEATRAEATASPR